MAIYGYTRVSTDVQVEGNGLEVQERMIRGYCMMHGMDPVEIVAEEGVSGSVPIDQRPTGKALLGRLQPGDTIIASKLDRVFRSALDALQTVEMFRKMGVNLHLLDLGGDVMGNGLSRLFLTISAAFAEAERDRIRERIKDTKKELRKQGRFLGGVVPFGHRIEGDKVVAEDWWPGLRCLILAWKAEGRSTRWISEALVEHGHKVSHVTVGRILKEIA